MKSSFIIALSILALSAVTTISRSVRADDIDPVVSAQKEEGLEADHDTMQIQDLDAEQKNAKEQALLQEKITKDAKSRLEKVEIKKDEKQTQAGEEISLYEARRKEAEKENKSYTEQVNKFTAEVDKLDQSIAKAKQAAKDAEDIAAAGREELTIVQQHKAKLEEENRQALYQQTQAQDEVARLKAQYAQDATMLKDLQARLQMNQQERKKNLGTQAVLTQKINSMESQAAQIRSKLGMKPVAVLPRRVSPPDDNSVPAPEILPSSGMNQKNTQQPSSRVTASYMDHPATTDGTMPAGPEVQAVRKDGGACDPVIDPTCPKN